MDSRAGTIDEKKLGQMKHVLKLINRLLTKANFQLLLQKRQVIYKLTQYFAYPPVKNYKIPQKLTSEAVNLYTSFAYSFYEIYRLPAVELFDQFEKLNRKLLKKCKKRMNKPLVKFSLIAKGLFSVKNFEKLNEEDCKKDCEKEISTINKFRKNKLLNSVFLIDKIKIENNSNIFYPKLLNKKTLPLSFTIDNLNSDAFEKVLSILIEMAEIGFKLKKNFSESAIECFNVYYGEVFYDFKSLISHKFTCFDSNDDKTSVQLKIYEFFGPLVLNCINQGL